MHSSRVNSANDAARSELNEHNNNCFAHFTKSYLINVRQLHVSLIRRFNSDTLRYCVYQFWFCPDINKSHHFGTHTLQEQRQRKNWATKNAHTVDTILNIRYRTHQRYSTWAQSAWAHNKNTQKKNANTGPTWLNESEYIIYDFSYKTQQ